MKKASNTIELYREANCAKRLQDFLKETADRVINPVAAFFLSEVFAAHDRVSRHATDIARLEVEPGFDLLSGVRS